MPTKKTVAASPEVSLYDPLASNQRPRLHKLIIRNFCAIGSTPVEIELDDIVVLVGPNNVGKSSILRAYEMVMNHGSKDGHLSHNDFPNGKIDPSALPEIELQTVVFDYVPGKEWIAENPITGERVVRERWFWQEPGAPIRQGYNTQDAAWSEKVPWGAPNVAKSRRPQPHRIDAFASPDKQSAEIVKLLISVLEEQIKSIRSTSLDGQKTDYAILLDRIGEMQRKIVVASEDKINELQSQFSEALGKVFPGYVVQFDAKPEDDLDKCLTLFKNTPHLLIGPADGYLSPVDRQGSGARRTLLWTALRIIKENDDKKGKSIEETRPHVLLLDEPEICLHPNAIREARRVLYDLPESKNWQVMITTHSPVFIDLSKDNTTIIRVERTTDGQVKGTTLFRPERAQLDADDRTRLKLLNLCDPYVNEFFFGGRILIVEGDTEYTAFQYIIDLYPSEFQDLQIIRARGKATIVSLMKVLNQFSVSYTILHDSDRPKVIRKDGTTRNNSAWTENKTIYDSIENAPDPNRVHRVASIPNFEEAFFGDKVQGDKPYTALSRIQENPSVLETLKNLLHSLVDEQHDVPEGAVRWVDIEELQRVVDSLEVTAL